MRCERARRGPLPGPGKQTPGPRSTAPQPRSPVDLHSQHPQTATPRRVSFALRPDRAASSPGAPGTATGGREGGRCTAPPPHAAAFPPATQWPGVPPAARLRGAVTSRAGSSSSPDGDDAQLLGGGQAAPGPGQELAAPEEGAQAGGRGDGRAAAGRAGGRCAVPLRPVSLRRLHRRPLTNGRPAPAPRPCAPPARAPIGPRRRPPTGRRVAVRAQRGRGGAGRRPRPIGGRDVSERGANREPQAPARVKESGGPVFVRRRQRGAGGAFPEKGGEPRLHLSRTERPPKMPANVEIKARVQDLAQLITRAEQLSGSPGSLLLQTDTFFPVPHGRLKVRDFRDGRGQLVFYDRPNSTGPKLSRFTVSPTHDPGGLVEALSLALGKQGVVKKERHLYRVGQTRVHVDRVEGLGDFVELEVVLEEQQSPQEGKDVAWQLMGQLGIEEKELVSGTYMDLLLAGGGGGGGGGGGEPLCDEAALNGHSRELLEDQALHPLEEPLPSALQMTTLDFQLAGGLSGRHQPGEGSLSMLLLAQGSQQLVLVHGPGSVACPQFLWAASVQSLASYRAEVARACCGTAAASSSLAGCLQDGEFSLLGLSGGDRAGKAFLPSEPRSTTQGPHGAPRQAPSRGKTGGRPLPQRPLAARVAPFSARSRDSSLRPPFSTSGADSSPPPAAGSTARAPPPPGAPSLCNRAPDTGNGRPLCFAAGWGGREGLGHCRRRLPRPARLEESRRASAVGRGRCGASLGLAPPPPPPPAAPEHDGLEGIGCAARSPPPPQPGERRPPRAVYRGPAGGSASAPWLLLLLRLLLRASPGSPRSEEPPPPGPARPRRPPPRLASPLARPCSARLRRRRWRIGRRCSRSPPSTRSRRPVAGPSPEAAREAGGRVLGARLQPERRLADAASSASRGTSAPRVEQLGLGAAAETVPSAERWAAPREQLGLVPAGPARHLGSGRARLETARLLLGSLLPTAKGVSGRPLPARPSKRPVRAVPSDSPRGPSSLPSLACRRFGGGAVLGPETERSCFSSSLEIRPPSSHGEFGPDRAALERPRRSGTPPAAALSGSCSGALRSFPAQSRAWAWEAGGGRLSRPSFGGAPGQTPSLPCCGEGALGTRGPEGP
ncbi:adenylate cyclase CyaB-like [Crotalus adamanteus]|uniref:Adenylate cyclase CyaB-like n=1 Tax=Crotalus adamanteus TaxID=8729 RepID=A0AAW1BEE4_CROAD